MRKRLVALACCLAFLALSAGCVTLNLEPNASLDQVEGSFHRAQKRAEQTPAKRLGKKPKRVHVLTYDEEGGELIQISVPMWMVRMALRFAEQDEPIEIDGVELDWREVLKHGSGIYVSITDDEQRTLVWLD